MINLLDPNGMRLSHQESCSYMNDYLTNFGVNLKSEFSFLPPAEKQTFEYYNKVQFDNEYEITCENMIQAVKDIDCSKGSGIDYLPTFIIEDAFLGIPAQVTYIMNLSLRSGIFPMKWAIATVTPIQKCGDMHKVGNWRPISILPLPGKILEKLCTQF